MSEYYDTRQQCQECGLFHDTDDDWCDGLGVAPYSGKPCRKGHEATCDTLCKGWECRVEERNKASQNEREQAQAKDLSPASTCSHCVELEEKLESVKAALLDPQSVHINTLRGTIAKLSDANVKHVYPHLFEND